MNCLDISILPIEAKLISAIEHVSDEAEGVSRGRGTDAEMKRGWQVIHGLRSRLEDQCRHTKDLCHGLVARTDIKALDLYALGSVRWI